MSEKVKKMAESFREILESDDYATQRQIINREINYGDPRDQYITDRSVFQKSKKEKEKLYELKKEYESGNHFLRD